MAALLLVERADDLDLAIAAAHLCIPTARPCFMPGLLHLALLCFRLGVVGRLGTPGSVPVVSCDAIHAGSRVSMSIAHRCGASSQARRQGPSVTMDLDGCVSFKPRRSAMACFAPSSVLFPETFSVFALVLGVFGVHGISSYAC